MNRAELAERISAKLGLTKKQAEDILETFEAEVINALKAGKEVTLTGFGSFEPRERHARMGVNPLKPTERIHMPRVVVPKFRAGKRLKDALKESAPKETPQSASQQETPGISAR